MDQLFNGISAKCVSQTSKTNNVAKLRAFKNEKNKTDKEKPQERAC